MRDEEGHMKWCCIGFENMSGEVGKRGAAVLVDASVASERRVSSCSSAL